MSDCHPIRRAGTGLALSALMILLGLAPAGPARAEVSSSFDADTGRLTVSGQNGDDIAVGCQAGQVRVNGEAASGPPVACVAVMSVLAGIDSEQAAGSRIDLSGMGPVDFPSLAQSGLVGSLGDDVVIGSAIADVLAGSAGNDRLSGGTGADQVFGGDGLDDSEPDGDDTLVWNDGDGSDVLNAQAGNDTVVVNGSATAGDDFAVSPGGARVGFERRNLTPFRLDIVHAESLQANGGGGDDRITGSLGLAPLIKLSMNGGAGNDLLTGGDGDDVMAGNEGDDRMVWNDGDGSDVMDGGEGHDVTEVNGAPEDGDEFTATPNGARVRFTRINLVPFALDIATTEQLLVNAGGGADAIRPAQGLAGLIAGAFYGQEGDDRLRGTDGADVLSGGSGDDTLRAKDRVADRVDCGEGNDFTRVDRRDGTRDCERRVGARPMVRLRSKVASVRGEVSLIRMRCVGVPRCGVSVKLRRGRVALGSGRLSLKGTRTARVRLNRRARRLASQASARGVRVALEIRANDSLGNGWQSTAKIRLTG